MQKCVCYGDGIFFANLKYYVKQQVPYYSFIVRNVLDDAPVFFAKIYKAR